MASRQKSKSGTITARLPDFTSYFLIGSYALISPFLISDRLLDPVLSLRFTFLSISLFIILLLIAIFKKSRAFDSSILKRRIFLIYAFYLGISALSLIATINLLEGIYELLKIAMMVIFFGTSAIVFVNVPHSIERLTKAVIITSLASAVIGICQNYGVAFNSLPGHFVVYGTMINKNFFASFLFLTLPFTLYGFFCLRNNWDIAAGLASILSLWCIVLAASRGVWLAILVAAIGVGIIGLFALRKISFSKNEKKQLVIRAAILLIAFLSLSSLSYRQASRQERGESPLQEKITSASSIGPETAKVRLILWGKTLKMIGDHPFIGVGLGNWKINIPRYKTTGLPSEQGRVHYIRPHNDYLWIWAETGPLGLLAYLSLFAISFYYLFKTLNRANGWRSKFLLLMIFFGIIGFGVISNFSFPKDRITHLIFINFLFVTTLVKYHREFKNPEILDNLKSPGKRRSEVKAGLQVSLTPLLIISLIILIIAGIFGYYRIRADARIMMAYYYWNKKQWQKMAEEAQKAESPFVNLEHNAAPIAWFQGIAYKSLDQKERALEVLKKADKAHPYHIQVLDNLATCYEFLGDHANAIKYYEKVLEISPHFENVLRNLSVIYYNRGEYKKAIQAYSQTDIYSRNETLFKYLEIYQSKMNENK